MRILVSPQVLEAAGGAPAAAGSTPSPSKPSVPTPAPAPEPAKPSVPSHKSAAVFEAIGTALAADGAALVNKTKGIFKFIIALEGGAPPVEYILDLKNGSGQLTPPGAKYSGPAPDLEIRVSDDDFVALAQGKLNAQQVCASACGAHLRRERVPLQPCVVADLNQHKCYLHPPPPPVHVSALCACDCAGLHEGEVEIEGRHGAGDETRGCAVGRAGTTLRPHVRPTLYTSVCSVVVATTSSARA